MLGHWGGSAFWFYSVQAVAITFEEVVGAIMRGYGIGLGSGVKRDGDRHGEESRSGEWKWKILGYLWVWAWFTYTVDPVISTLMIQHADHFSIILGVWKGEWVPRIQ